jgi:hypothetical protein
LIQKQNKPRAGEWTFRNIDEAVWLNHGSPTISPRAISEEGREEQRTGLEYAAYFAQCTFYSVPAVAIKADILHDTIEAAHYSKSVLFIPLLLINLEVKPMIGMVRTGHS